MSGSFGPVGSSSPSCSSNIVELDEGYAEATVVVDNIVVLGENFAEETVAVAVVDVVVDNIVC